MKNSHEKTIQALEAKIDGLAYSRDLWKAAAINIQGILQASGWSPYTEGQKALEAVNAILRSEKEH